MIDINIARTNKVCAICEKEIPKGTDQVRSTGGFGSRNKTTTYYHRDCLINFLTDDKKEMVECDECDHKTEKILKNRNSRGGYTCPICSIACR